MLSRAHSLAAVLLLVMTAYEGASAVTFDFNTLPDSAGCSGPVATAGGDRSTCDVDWLDGTDSGTITFHDQTIDGVTLHLTTEIGSAGIDWDTGMFSPGGGAIYCGNEDDCTPYLATFSVPVSSVELDVLGLEDRGGSQGNPVPDTIYLRIYDGPGGTGALLDALVLDALANPFSQHLVLAAPGILSAAFGASTAAGTENIGVIDNLAVVVPEPGTAGLFAIGMATLGLVGLRQRRVRLP